MIFMQSPFHAFVGLTLLWVIVIWLLQTNVGETLKEIVRWFMRDNPPTHILHKKYTKPIKPTAEQCRKTCSCAIVCQLPRTTLPTARLIRKKDLG